MDQYLYQDFKQRYYYSFRTTNCQAYWIKENSEFQTEHYGYFEQDKIVPRTSLKFGILSFEKLKSHDSYESYLDNFLIELTETITLLEEKLQNDKINEPIFLPREGNKQRSLNEKEVLFTKIKENIDGIKEAIDLIKDDVNVKEAFLKTNETFYEYYKSKKISNAGWRLFQLAFLLSSIDSIANDSNLDVVDVLHVDTGGGKSEAYFALVIFSAFYERLLGKENGVSAIVKFPLRMLSIQQLERISAILIFAESIRKKYLSLFKGEFFSLGYYVGNSEDFPDLYGKVKDKLYKNKKLIEPAPESIIISKCPICTKGILRLYDEPIYKRIIHKCDECENTFHIFTSDREVFRWRPTIIVSTVDKWAAVSQQRRIRNLLGGTGSFCEKKHGFIPSGDVCEDKRDEDFTCDIIGEKNITKNGPKLSIQDEMHLLSEGFGTISGHFEGLIEAIVEENTERKLKHIAMSATLNGTSNQIEELYKKKTRVLPGKCPEGHGSKYDFFFEKKNEPNRFIFGLKPNLRDNHYASLRTILHFAEFILESQKQLLEFEEDFLQKYKIENNKLAQNLINQYLIPLTYHIKKQDAYDMLRLKSQVIEDELKQKYNAEIHGNVLTGDSNLEKLKAVIDSVRNYVNDYDPKKSINNLSLEPLYATSVVSHGVDLDELNFMIFQGLPYSTSEYIQALSRVGRKKLGIIILWFYPNRVRDDSFYKNFKRYHETLDHYVKPIPLKRFSRLGLQQTINSLFCASIINYLANIKGKSMHRKSNIKELTNDDKLKIVDFIKSAYKREILDINVETEVEDRINQIINSNDSDKTYFPNILLDSGEYYYRNQSGMRGIQKQLILSLQSSDQDIIEERRR